MNAMLKTFFCVSIFYLCTVSPCLSIETANSNTTEVNKEAAKTTSEQTTKSDKQEITEQTKDASKAPSVFFPAPRFEFDRMVEGEDLLHDFVVMNKGTDILQIRKVKTSCGCTTVSYSKEVPPGGEGKISMKVNTRGYGGRTLRKTITVITNDTVTPNTTLTVSGSIENFVTITPRVLRLTGKIGDELKSVVKIIPESKYPFSITAIHARNGKNIKYELNENRSASGGKEYAITVENVKKDAGSYYDILILKTDSKIQPEIKITVMTRLMDIDAPTKAPAKASLTGEKRNNETNGTNKESNFLEVIQKMQQQNTTGVNGNGAPIQSPTAVQDPERAKALKKKFEALIKQARERQNSEEQQKKQ